MKIARKPLTEKEEIDGQIIWFNDLAASITAGRTDEALAAIAAAIQLLSTSAVGGDDRSNRLE